MVYIWVLKVLLTLTDNGNLQQCNFWLCNNATFFFIVYYFHVNLQISPVVRYLKTTVSLLQYFFEFVANLLFSVYYYYYFFFSARPHEACRLKIKLNCFTD